MATLLDQLELTRKLTNEATERMRSIIWRACDTGAEATIDPLPNEHDTFVIHDRQGCSYIVRVIPMRNTYNACYTQAGEKLTR